MRGLVQTGAPSRWRYHYTPKAAKFWGELGGGIGASVMEGLWRDTSVDPYRPGFTPCLQPLSGLSIGASLRRGPRWPERHKLSLIDLSTRGLSFQIRIALRASTTSLTYALAPPHSDGPTRGQIPVSPARLSHRMTDIDRLGRSAIVALMSAHTMPIATLNPGEVARVEADDLNRLIRDACFGRANSLALTVSQTRCCKPGVFNHGCCRL
jgi:hypothetical protein